MSSGAKAIATLFRLLALIALGHDIYVWQNSEGHPFAFAALGWISKTYAPEQHQFVVDVLGADSFNAVLTPLLKIPAFFFALGLIGLTALVDIANRRLKNEESAPKAKDFKYTRK